MSFARIAVAFVSLPHSVSLFQVPNLLLSFLPHSEEALSGAKLAFEFFAAFGFIVSVSSSGNGLSEVSFI